MNKPNRTEIRDDRRFQWVGRCWLVVLLSMPLVHGGCTAALWEQVDPDGREWIPASKITEEQLRQQGRKYSKTRWPRQGTGEVGARREEDMVDGYYAEKSRLQKFNDAVVLTVGTPVAVVIDGAIVCGLVAGCVALHVLANSPELLGPAR